MTNLYHVLEISEDATPEQIKSAFKQLAKKYHPDKNQGNLEMEKKFKEINEAHQILSNKYEKAKFDLKLNYQHTYQKQPQTPSYRPPHTQYQERRKQYTNRRPSSKQNNIATVYAFGFTFIIGLLIITGSQIKEYYDTQKLNTLLAERKTTYTEAKANFEQGNYSNSFELMDSLRFYRPEEQYMKNFYTLLFKKTIEKGHQKYDKGEYFKAIYLYEIIRKYAPHQSLFNLRKQLADAYHKTEQPTKAIAILKKFLVEQYEIIPSLIKIATIERDNLKNLEKALDYILIAHRLAIKGYKIYYGEGYAFVINEKNIPVSHHLLYNTLADIYLKKGDIEMAIKTADWNKYVWPDSSQSYIISGNAYLKLGQLSNACAEFKEAIKRKWKDSLPDFCL